MHLPRGGEEYFDVFVREEMGLAVGAVDHADFPFVRVVSRTGLLACPARRLADVQHIAGAEDARGVAAEAPADEGTLAAQIIGPIYATGDRQVGAAAGALRAAHFKHRAR